MFYHLHTLTQEALQHQLRALINDQYGMTLSRHVDLTQMINELSVTGFPLLISAAEALLAEDRSAQTWISAPLRSALERACSGVESAGPAIERRFDTPEEEHLLDQLQALMIDLEQLLIVSEEDEIARLRTLLWIGATRHLIRRAREERNHRLRLLLIYASDELGTLALTPERFEREASDVLAERLRLCYAGGGALSLILPSAEDDVQVAQLWASEIALDLRGVERLTIDGHDVSSWLLAVERGLDEVQTIKILMLSDDDAEALRGCGLLERVEAGWSPSRVVDQVAGVDFTMVYCPAGELRVGSDASSRYGLERTRYRIKITEPFWVGRARVTQPQWERVTGDNPSYFKDDRLPVAQVSWLDCVRFCNALSEHAGLEPVYDIKYIVDSDEESTVHTDLTRGGYRLPTKREWRYMAKAGAERFRARSNPLNVRYELQEDELQGDRLHYRTQERERMVALFLEEREPNAWGIYDCLDQSHEWCHDDREQTFDWRRSNHIGLRIVRAVR